jgi:hypothetical protein
VLRLTETEHAVAEIAAVAEHVASMTAATSAFRIEPDVPPGAPVPSAGPLVSLDGPASPDARSTLDEIRAWMREALGLDYVPAVWRALAHQPKLLSTTWKKERLVMAPGALDELVKGCAALAVAELRQSVYWTSYYSHFLRRRSGLDDAALVEIAGAVMHYVSFNTIAHGMRLPPPVSELTAAAVAPGGPHEEVVPGVRRRPPR